MTDLALISNYPLNASLNDIIRSSRNIGRNTSILVTIVPLETFPLHSDLAGHGADLYTELPSQSQHFDSSMDMDQGIGSIERITNKIDDLFVIFSITALLGMLATTTISIVGRNLFDTPIPDDIVINELLIVVMVFLPVAYVQRQKKHLSVTLLSSWLSARTALKLDLFSALFGALFFLILSYATFFDFYAAFTVRAYNEGVLELPEYPSRFAVFIGVLLMEIRLLLDVAKYVGRLRHSENIATG